MLHNISFITSHFISGLNSWWHLCCWISYALPVKVRSQWQILSGNIHCLLQCHKSPIWASSSFFISSSFWESFHFWGCLLKLSVFHSLSQSLSQGVFCSYASFSWKPYGNLMVIWLLSHGNLMVISRKSRGMCMETSYKSHGNFMIISW